MALKETIVRMLQMRAKAEESPPAPALMVARAIDNPSGKAIILAEILRQYAEAGEKERGLETLSQAFQVARTIAQAGQIALGGRRVLREARA